LISMILSKPIETTRYPVWLPKCGNITRLTLSILTHDKPKMDNSTWMRDSTTFLSALIYLISRSCEILNENWRNDWKKPSMVSGVPFSRQSTVHLHWFGKKTLIMKYKTTQNFQFYLPGGY
jgi:hypothetical protein